MKLEISLRKKEKSKIEMISVATNKIVTNVLSPIFKSNFIIL